ncbi:2OG-Fe(II) oxygenase [Streptomyces sp. NBC_01373]|uniref:2OG-Fe(II) oxygenase n=1 Tax=Streptomyces sp. NBC_01373 TaxID=2903843 RepID=UPI00225B10BA|nr:2OG-Fe(II) oxygenase [Streptomyces sp. NBC_01373]MCX4704374.1 2OG-Fe(II) oxygenase [Streptomyces sp. NBC_01373]MCX4707114.1 2OG-Fe(II) oxygenase [Streptomyces sp. NBC_01373]
MTAATFDLAPLHEQFASAQPFPHIVLDGLWQEDELRACAAEFPPGDDRRWITYPDPKEYGKRAGASIMWGPMTRNFFALAQSLAMCGRLEELTGIGPLTADDVGGGMHMTGEGGRLAMHRDFNVHPTQPLERRLNLLVFLNEEWERKWGGTLYLGASGEVAVEPLFNRTVIFACGSRSWHGHPEPIVGEHWRRSLACYYYAPLRAETGDAHSTVWGER